jgi:hypothetical protein
MICRNCEHSFDGNFCNNCGQKSNIQRINSHYILDEISNSVFQVDRGLFFTIKNLALRPGHSIRDYIIGKRKNHFKPLAFILIVSAFYVLITHYTGKETSLGSSMSGIANAISDDEFGLSKTGNILKWLSNNFAYATLLLLPVFSFASYISFKKAKYNYFEHLILNFYITGQQIIIYLIFALLFFVFRIEGYYIQLLPFIATIAYTFWVFIQFFKTGNLFSKIMLTLLTYLLSYILFIILGILVAIIELFLKG